MKVAPDAVCYCGWEGIDNDGCTCLTAAPAVIVQRDWVEEPLQVLSYGGGVQSTAMLVMIQQGVLPRPDLIIHADTGSELPETVAFIEIARAFVEEEIGIPFIIVRSERGALHEYNLQTKTIPMIGVRSCTDNFKITPQRRLMREIVGKKPRGKMLAEGWLGISTDEARRRTDSTVKWAGLRYPLLDDVPTTRDECIAINESMGWTVGKSGCFHCPYQGGKTWLKLKADHPDLFSLAVELEETKFEAKGGKMGLYQENRLSELDEVNLPDSACDSGGGCFI